MTSFIPKKQLFLGVKCRLMDKYENMIETETLLPRNEKRTIPGIFDVEIHAEVPRSSVTVRLPARYRKRSEEGYLLHGLLNFDQRGGGTRRDVDDGAASSPEALRKSLLDPHGIRIALLTATDYEASIYPDLDFNNAFAAAYNQALIEEFVEQDDAMLGSLRLNFNDPDAAVREITRWADHPKVAAIISPTASIESPGSRRYDPVFAAAADAGLVLTYHTTSEGRSQTAAPSSAGYPSRYFEYHSALASSAIGHAASLITNGVFARHPALKVVYLEGGIAWALPLMWSLDADWKLFRDEVPDLKEAPSHYLKNHIYFTTQPIEEPGRGADLLTVFEQIGLERNIVYSTDFPHWDFDDPKHFLPGCFSQEQRDRILWHNAAELFAQKTEPLLREVTNG